VVSPAEDYCCLVLPDPAHGRRPREPEPSPLTQTEHLSDESPTLLASITRSTTETETKMANVIPMLADDRDDNRAIIRAGVRLKDVRPLEGTKKFSQLFNGTIGVIHQISGFLGVPLKRLEFYLGRSSDSRGAVRSLNIEDRFMQHHTGKGHSFAVVLYRTTIRRSVRYETAGIRLLDRLRSVGSLCIRNSSKGGGGGIGSYGNGYLYLTCGILPRAERAARETTPEQRREIANAVSKGLGGTTAQSANKASLSALVKADDLDYSGRLRLDWRMLNLFR
jgi:hypothetical protein